MSTVAGDKAETSPLAIVFVGSLLPNHLVADYPAAHVPGIRFQYGVLEALVARGIDTCVISLRPVSSYPRSPQLFYRGTSGKLTDGVNFHQIGFINAGPFKTLTAAFTALHALLRWARQYRHNRRLFLFYNTYNPSGWVGIFAAWITRSRSVAVVADINVPGAGRVGASFLRHVEYHIATAGLRRMHAIVTVTRAIAEDFAAGVPCLYLDGGVPQDMLAPLPGSIPAHVHDDARARRTSDTDPFVIMYAGGLSAFQGVLLLLQAFQRLEHSRFQLWISGRGELESDVRRAAESDSRIRYLGFLTRPNLLATYAMVDLLVNPCLTAHLSARYSFPSKLLEYLATGRPVITTATPEIAAAYGDLCTVLKCEQPQALAEAIAQVAAVPAAERLERAAAARVAVIERRSWPQLGRRLVQFLEEQSSLNSG